MDVDERREKQTASFPTGPSTQGCAQHDAGARSAFTDELMKAGDGRLRERDRQEVSLAPKPVDDYHCLRTADIRGPNNNNYNDNCYYHVLVVF